MRFLDKMNLTARVSIPLVLVLACAGAAVSWYIQKASTDNMVQSSLESAQHAIDEWKTLRAYYTNNIVGKVKSGNFNISFDHKDKADAIPLPATLIQDLSEEFSKTKDAARLSLYSAHPFPNRKDRKLDQFSQDAIAYFQKNPDATYFYRQDAMGGTPYLRVAQPDKMVAESCVSCHNTRADSPKTDWKLGDVRGVLEYSLPIATQMAHTNEVTRNIIFALSGAIIFAWFIAFTILRSANSNLTKVASALAKESSNINTSSVDLNNASHTVSSSSHEQAAAVQENVAAMSEISSMVDRTSELSQTSLHAAKSVSQKSAEGTDVMHKLVDAMEGIKAANDQLENISAVITTIAEKTNIINDIVFKTQLLSFNASIEAARAGQHGRGFAVVAEEVGNLAQLSGGAAADIRSLIEDSQKQVQGFVKSTQERISRGEEVTTEAKKIFDQISSQIEAIRKQVESVSEANNEQKQGIQQVSQAMSQIDEATQANTEASRKVDELSTQLRKRSQQLGKIASTINWLIHGYNATQRQSMDMMPTAEKGNLVPFKKGMKTPNEDMSYTETRPNNTSNKQVDFDADDDSFKDAV
ncbi:MAG: methyl-accepting chemotaxis protein [Oligoflexales bacterium]